MMLITTMLTITKRRAKVQSTDIQNVENKIVLKRSCNRFVGRQNSAPHCTTMMGSEDCHALFLWRQIWTQGFHALFRSLCSFGDKSGHKDSMPFSVSVFLWRQIWTQGFHALFCLCSFGDQQGHMDFMSFSLFLWRRILTQGSHASACLLVPLETSMDIRIP